MQSVYITKYGPPEVLELRSGEDPVPEPGEVRIRVHASGINFADISARVGLYPDAPKPPCVVGYEVAGVVDDVGAGVDGRVEVGDRVMAMVRFGGYADVVCAPLDQLRKIPDGMSFEAAAALLVNYLTAYHCLFETGPVHPGAKVLVHMAAGGVGLAVIQLLQAVPDVVIFGTSSKGKHDILRQEGAAHPIDYRSVDYAEEVRRITGKKTPLDIVLDPLGGADWKKGYDLLYPTGRLVAYGFANAVTGTRRNWLKVIGQALRIPKFNPMKLMDKNRGVFGVNLGHLWDHVEILSREIDALVALYPKGRIKPRVDSTFPLAEAAAAHQHIQDRKNIGKVVLTTDHFEANNGEQ